MDTGSYTASTGLAAGLRHQELIAANLANLRTAGYKRQTPIIESFNAALEAAATQEGVPGIYPVEISGVSVDFSPGPLTHTDNPLDLAIEGKGFFVVRTANGDRYTRNGQFTRAADETLVTQSGAAVLGTGGAIQIPAGAANIRVDRHGEITGYDASVQPPIPIRLGRIRVVTFADESVLKPAGLSAFMMDGSEGAPIEATDAIVRQGYIEESNVQAVDELVRMISVLRDFESAQRTLSSIEAAEEETAKARSQTI